MSLITRLGRDPATGFDDVGFVYQRLMIGTGRITAVQPRHAYVPRAMLVTVLYRLAGSGCLRPAPAFTDVPEGSWYGNAVAWAAANGITVGVGDNRFARTIMSHANRRRRF